MLRLRFAAFKYRIIPTTEVCVRKSVLRPTQMAYRMQHRVYHDDFRSVLQGAGELI